MVIDRLPRPTVFEQIQLVRAEDGRTVCVSAFYDGVESLNVEFELPPAVRDLPFNADEWESHLLSGFRGTVH